MIFSVCVNDLQLEGCVPKVGRALLLETFILTFHRVEGCE